MADKQLIWSTLRYPENGVMLPAYYLDNEYDPVAVRIYADSPPGGVDVTFDIFADGVSLFNDQDADTSDLTANYQHKHIANTKISLDAQDSVELMAENFTEGLVLEAESWITCKMYSDGGAKNITIILELDQVSESDEYSD